MADAAKPRATYAEYTALDDASDVKHEYVAGQIVAMAGGTIEHGRLISRCTVLLSNALAGRPCAVLPSDVRVRIRAADRATYPDLHVVCGSVERDPDDERAVVNPVLILEGICVDGRCGSLPPGSSCSFGDECEGCVDGVCASPVDEGASCGWGLARCGEGLACTYRPAEPTCVPTCASR